VGPEAALVPVVSPVVLVVLRRHPAVSALAARSRPAADPAVALAAVLPQPTRNRPVAPGTLVHPLRRRVHPPPALLAAARALQGLRNPLTLASRDCPALVAGRTSQGPAALVALAPSTRQAAAAAGRR
jgi:hypothetical protein